VKAQDAIVRGLRNKFGEKLKIVGEEDSEKTFEDDCKNYSSEVEIAALGESVEKYELVEATILRGFALDTDKNDKKENFTVPANDIVIFIDPVDGTREFVEGRLDAVQNLIGISIRGRAVAGIVGLPFFSEGFSGDSENKYVSAADIKSGTGISSVRSNGSEFKLKNSNSEVKVIFGVVGSESGISGIDQTKNTKNTHSPETQTTLALSSDRGEKTPWMKTARDIILLETKSDSKSTQNRVLLAGGCGNKIYRLLTGQANVALLNNQACLWDTCAPEALLRCIGGKLTTIFGWNIDYHVPDTFFENKKTFFSEKMKFGAVATMADFKFSDEKAHESLCSEFLKNKTILSVIKDIDMNKSTGTSAPPVDVARNLFGDPFSANELAHYLQGTITNDETINDHSPAPSYSLDADSAIRYKLSHACRIKIISPTKTTSTFCKRAVLRELQYAMEKSIKTPYKLARDIKANTNEAIFLNECVKDSEVFKGKFGNQGKSKILRVFPPYFC
jgi:3'-phosphoadenosine 5'-phosphosulfate (PAPS) 3'-phosphatase